MQGSSLESSNPLLRAHRSMRRWSLMEWAAVSAWVALLVTIAILIAVRPHFNAVYFIWSNAGKNWIQGCDVYHYYGTDGGIDQYRYSPLVAASMAPFSQLPDLMGGMLWRLLNAAIFLGSLGWFIRVVLPQPLSRSQRAWIFLLVMPLAIPSFYNGQSNPIVIGLLLAAVAGTIRKSWNIVALCLGIACLVKVYPIAIVMLLGLFHPKQILLRFALVIAAGLALPFALQNPDYVWKLYADWLYLMRIDDRSNLPAEGMYRDLRLLFRIWLQPLPPYVYPIIQMIVAAGIAAFCYYLHRRGASEKRVLTLVLGLGCCWMTVFGSAAEASTYILLAPTAAWALLDSRITRCPAFDRFLMLASAVLFLGAQMAIWFPGGASKVHTLGPHPFAALLVFAYLIHREILVLREDQQDVQIRTEFSLPKAA